jgi:hypothetical protein
MTSRPAHALVSEASKLRAAASLVAMLTLGTACLSAHADDCISNGDGTGACANAQISQIYVESGAGNAGWAYIKTTGAMSALPCTLDGGYVRLPATDSNYKIAYATLLAAQLAQRTVDVKVTKDASGMCQIAYFVQH